MKENNFQDLLTKTSSITSLLRTVLYCGIIALPLSPVIYIVLSTILSTIFTSHPNQTDAIDLTDIISGDYSPKSFALVYSEQYMEVLSSNMCFVYRYPEGYYPAPKSKFNYLNQNTNLGNKDFSDFSFDFGKEVEPKEGCFKFISNLDNEDAKLFVDHGFHYEYGRGSKIFINDRDNLIMFEGYIYD